MMTLNFQRSPGSRPILFSIANFIMSQIRGLHFFFCSCICQCFNDFKLPEALAVRLAVVAVPDRVACRVRAAGDGVRAIVKVLVRTVNSSKYPFHGIYSYQYSRPRQSILPGIRALNQSILATLVQNYLSHNVPFLDCICSFTFICSLTSILQVMLIIILTKKHRCQFCLSLISTLMRIMKSFRTT